MNSGHLKNSKHLLKKNQKPVVTVTMIKTDITLLHMILKDHQRVTKTLGSVFNIKFLPVIWSTIIHQALTPTPPPLGKTKLCNFSWIVFCIVSLLALPLLNNLVLQNMKSFSAPLHGHVLLPVDIVILDWPHRGITPVDYSFHLKLSLLLTTLSAYCPLPLWMLPSVPFLSSSSSAYLLKVVALQAVVLGPHFISVFTCPDITIPTLTVLIIIYFLGPPRDRFLILVKSFPQILDAFIYQISLLGLFVSTFDSKYPKFNQWILPIFS